MPITSEYRIYVTCLAAYNDGILHGKWIDLEGKDGDDIREEVAAMLKASPVPGAEEWAIHDYQGVVVDSEWADFDEIAAQVELLEEHGEAWKLYRENFGDSATVEGFQEAYQGAFDSLEDWAEEFAEDTGLLSEVPESLRWYFDYRSYGRDCESNGDIWCDRGDDGLHVYWNN